MERARFRVRRLRAEKDDVAPGQFAPTTSTTARLAQSAERKALNLVVVGSSPTVGVPVVNWILQSRFQETKAPDF